jgi:hypothetical protein
MVGRMSCSSIGRNVNLNRDRPELPPLQVELFRNSFIYLIAFRNVATRFLNRKAVGWH